MKQPALVLNEAEAQRDAFSEMVSVSDMATKRDIEHLRFDMQKDIAAMKFELLRWVIGLSLAQLGALIGILLKLH